MASLNFLPRTFSSALRMPTPEPTPKYLTSVKVGPAKAKPLPAGVFRKPISMATISATVASMRPDLRSRKAWSWVA